MGTRGCCGFRADGKDKLQYNHFDSYPTGLGVSMLSFIQSTPDSEIVKIAKRLKPVKEDKSPTPKQFEECKQYYNGNVGGPVSGDTTKPPTWYQTLRNAQGNFETYKTGLRYMLASNSFMQDSLFCEWAYVINTDEKVLEIYRGFNKNKNADGRYADCKPVSSSGEYFGVALVKTISFDEVRKIEDVTAWCGAFEDWLSKLEDAEETDNG